MILLLAACAPPPPSLQLEVEVPTAEHASAEPAARFVGPLDVANVADLCTTPADTLLREGHYGWRVLSVSGEHLRLPDGTDVSLGDGKPTALYALLKRWNAADRIVEARCGKKPDVDVLFAVDARSAYANPQVWLFESLPGNARLLVADGTPDAPLAAPAQPDAPRWMLAESTRSWAVLPIGTDDGSAAEYFDLGDTIADLARRKPGSVLVTLAPGLPVRDAVRTLDGLASLGIVPTFGLAVGDTEAAPAAPTFQPGRTFWMTDTLAVLTLDVRYATLTQVIGIGGAADAPEAVDPSGAPADAPEAVDPFGAGATPR